MIKKKNRKKTKRMYDNPERCQRVEKVQLIWYVVEQVVPSASVCKVKVRES